MMDAPNLTAIDQWVDSLSTPTLAAALDRLANDVRFYAPTERAALLRRAARIITKVQP